MEAAEDASLEAAIGWLVQTILVNLVAGSKLEAWIRQAGLADDIERLKSEVERVEMVVSAVKGRAIGNKPLSRSLARLKDLLYDADDVVDALDYLMLRQQVKGDTCGGGDPESMQAAEERSRGSSTEDILRDFAASIGCKEWKNLELIKWNSREYTEATYIHYNCPLIKCGSSNGTPVLNNHLKGKGCIRKRGASDQLRNPTRAGDATAYATPVVIDNSSSRKRMRTGEERAQTTAANAGTAWDRAKVNSTISKITSQLHDIQGEVGDILKILGLNCATCSVRRESTTSVQYFKTSSLVQKKIYGRVEEKNSIMKLMTKDRSDGVTVLPIVGIAGVGKTALAQHVYNDPEVKNQFERIWIWVSYKFDEARLTKEILDFVSPEIPPKISPDKNDRYDGISSFAKLQEILKGRMEFQSKRFLLILDDVWNNLDDYRWNKLLAPLITGHVKGNVIIVTTRNLSVAQRLGTIKPVKLGALANDVSWLLFKSHAFGDGSYEGHQNLSIIGQKIAEKLKGNPLAVESTGYLLRKKMETDHWGSILKNEKWKSLQLDGGIMPAFKLSYDQLPYHLQQCFSYCSIFPYNYQFLDEELVRIWISQGFVKCDHCCQRLEEIARSYLTDLVNLGFFQQVKKEETFLRSKIWYALCGLVHDFARVVSKNECATIDGLQYNEMLPTIQHLSIVTDSAYRKDQYGDITRNKAFEDNMRNTVTSVRKLRTVVFIGNYDPFLFKLFQDIFQKSYHLRLLQMSAGSADFNSIICSLINPTHLRYLKRGSDEGAFVCPKVLSKFYHLQVLDVGLNTSATAPNCTNNLVSLRHLVAAKDVHPSIGRISQMTSFQELEDFRVEDSSGFGITQLQAMNELVHLGVSQLQNVKSQQEAYGAKLKHKRHLEKLSLCWQCNDNLSEDESANYKEVLEGLEPNLELKHLQIYGYNGTSPTWLASNITSLQTLHLENCGKWETLPPLERLPFLRKLKLINMQRVIEVLVPSLEELVLENMPKLERCSVASVWYLHLKNCWQITQLLIEDEQDSQSNFTSAHAAAAGHPDIALAGSAPVDKLNSISPLKNIFIQYCPILTLNEGNKGLSRFTSLEKLTVGRCPKLLLSLVHKDINDDRANGRWILPQSLRELEIDCNSPETLELCFIENQTCLTKLKVWCMPDLKSLQLHSCTSLEDLKIIDCKSLVTLVGLQYLGSLKCLRIGNCPSLHPCLERLSMQGPELCPRLLRLESLSIPDGSLLTTSFCNHLSSLQCLNLSDWNIETTRLTDEQESGLQLLTSLQELEFRHFNKLVDLPAVLNRFLSLKRLRIMCCNGVSKLMGVGLLTSLQELALESCPKLVDLPSRFHELPFLKKLHIYYCPGILTLPVKGLPYSLEILKIGKCSHKLNVECRKLATRRIKVQIDWEWIN